MAEANEIEWRWRRECPRFSGVQAEYKAWRGQVEDWLTVCEELVKYPGIEIRLSLRGRALEVTEGMEREELKKKEGPKMILGKLDEVYLKDTLMENYGKMKRYLKIERESGEKMRDFIIRYEKDESECKRALGKCMFEGEAKGLHLLEQANLSENQKQLVLAACGQGKLEYGTVSQILKRTFEGLGSKEECEWWGSENYANLGRGREGYTNRGRENYRNRGRWNRGRGERNPPDREGKITLCGICKSEWHWARECPQKGGKNPVDKEGKITLCGICRSEWHWARECPQHIKKEENGQVKEKDEERVFIGEVSRADEDSWGEIDAILDTGCKSTVCGEL